MADLLELLVRETEGVAYRLSSYEPDRIDARFLAAFASPRLRSHLHLSAQSGCDETLARMGRGYRSDALGRAVRELRGAKGDLFLGADVIAGFPGVTDEEFESVRQGVLASLTKTPDTLDEEFGWYETDLRLGNAAFDGLERLVAAVEKAKLREVVRAYETLVLGPGGTRVLVQIQGSRFRDLGWADKKGAVQTPRFEDFHRVMGVQRYWGL
jgi:protease-3